METYVLFILNITCALYRLRGEGTYTQYRLLYTVFVSYFSIMNSREITAENAPPIFTVVPKLLL